MAGPRCRFRRAADRCRFRRGDRGCRVGATGRCGRASAAAGLVSPYCSRPSVVEAAARAGSREARVDGDHRPSERGPELGQSLLRGAGEHSVLHRGGLPRAEVSGGVADGADLGLVDQPVLPYLPRARQLGFEPHGLAQPGLRSPAGQAQRHPDLVRGVAAQPGSLVGHREVARVAGAAARELRRQPRLPSLRPRRQPVEPDDPVDQARIRHDRRIGRGVQIDGEQPRGAHPRQREVGDRLGIHAGLPPDHAVLGRRGQIQGLRRQRLQELEERGDDRPADGGGPRSAAATPASGTPSAACPRRRSGRAVRRARSRPGTPGSAEPSPGRRRAPRRPRPP